MGCGNRSGCYSNSFCAPAGARGPAGVSPIVDVDFSQTFITPGAAPVTSTGVTVPLNDDTNTNLIFDAFGIAGATASKTGTIVLEGVFDLTYTAAALGTATLAAVVGTRVGTTVTAAAGTTAVTLRVLPQPAVTGITSTVFAATFQVSYSADIAAGQSLFLTLNTGAFYTTPILTNGQFVTTLLA